LATAFWAGFPVLIGRHLDYITNFDSCDRQSAVLLPIAGQRSNRRQTIAEASASAKQNGKMQPILNCFSGENLL
jgi:hypothetical protein